MKPMQENTSPETWSQGRRARREHGDGVIVCVKWEECEEASP
jgi:hypothetical protein